MKKHTLDFPTSLTLFTFLYYNTVSMFKRFYSKSSSIVYKWMNKTTDPHTDHL